jgi:hypothetical protein
MPTIDQLAPATAASDTDELLVSQSGIARKITRSQVLAGVQQQLAVGSGSLLGRSSDGVGMPEQISVGANLALTGGVLSASATPFNIASLPSGLVPASGDFVALGQSGQNVAVTYSQFLSGLSGIGNVDLSQMLVTPTGGGSASKLADFAANTLPLSGGALTGPLTLVADPTASLQPATKQYVDAQASAALPKSGGTLTGTLTLAADPTAALQSATKQYVDAQVTTALPKSGGTLTGMLTLSASPTTALQAAPKQYVDTQIAATVLRGGSTMTGALTLATDPTSALQAATKQYVDKRLLRAGDTLTGPLILAADPVTALQAATKGYVDAQITVALPAAGGTLTGPLTLAADPATSMQAATKQYVDARVGTAVPLSGGTLTGPLTLAADPTSSLQGATKQYVDQRILRAGDILTGPLTLAADPTATLQAATKGYVDTQVAAAANAALPKAGGVMTGVLTLSSNPTASLHAATKQYADAGDAANATAIAAAHATASAALPISGGSITGNLNIVSGGTAPITLSAPGGYPRISTPSGKNLDLTPGGDNGTAVSLGTSSGPLGIVASAWFYTGGNANDGSTGNKLVVNNILQSNFYRSPINTYFLSGASLPTIFALGGNYTGTLTGTGMKAPFSFNCPTVSVDTTGQANGWWQGAFTQNFSGTKGGVGQLRLLTTQTGNTADTAGVTFFVNPFATYLDLEYAPGAGSFGNAIGMSSIVYMGGGAAGWALAEGTENAIVRASGATVGGSYISTLLFQAATSATSGRDAAIAFGAVGGSGVGLKQLLLLGRSNDQFPVNRDGWLLQATPQVTNNPGNAQRWPMACAGGWDFWNINFSSAALRSSGVSIESAAIKVGSATLAQGTNGPTIDATGYVGAINGVTGAGASYQVNDQLYDGLGGIILVDSVNAGGNITAAHYIPSKEPYRFGGASPATVSATGGSGNGAAQFSVAWTAKNALSIQPSGGAIGFYGATPVVRQTGVAVTVAAVHAALCNIGLISA